MSEPAADGYHETATDRDQVRLMDVAGMDEVKRRLELTVFNPWRNPELMKAYGKRVAGGLLLYGPPGCGRHCLPEQLPVN